MNPSTKNGGQSDYTQARSALAGLCQQVQARKLAHTTKLQVIRKAYDQAFAARKQLYEAKLGEYKAKANTLNSAVEVYNSKLEKYGTRADGSKPGSNTDSTNTETIQWVHIQPTKAP